MGETGIRLFNRHLSRYPEAERLQDVSLHGGWQQDDGGLWTVLVPVHINTLTLQQLQTALVWKHLNTRSTHSSRSADKTLQWEFVLINKLGSVLLQPGQSLQNFTASVISLRLYLKKKVLKIQMSSETMNRPTAALKRDSDGREYLVELYSLVSNEDDLIPVGPTET